MKTKKLITIILVLVMSFVIFGCGSGQFLEPTRISPPTLTSTVMQTSSPLPISTLTYTPTEMSTLTLSPSTQTPTLANLILSTIPPGCNEIVGYGWLGSIPPDRCFALNRKPECPNIEIDVTFCQCNDFYGLTRNYEEGHPCGEVSYPNPPAPLIIK